MIYVGSRDGRRGLGLGFGGGGEMEEFELEEGEACSYDDEANIDQDVDLSYLDEKVQDVLGHFQKDFEGGVSAENLGAKFGAYGSFLPTYQRSPSIWSHPRTPPKVQGYYISKSPNVLPSEGAPPNSTVPFIATSSARLGLASTSAAPQHVSRAAFVENSSKREMYLSSAKSTVEFTPKLEPVSKSINFTNHKTLKVRIKVGSDNMSQANAAIYSGLGLDISPSSSLEDSRVESGGLSPESQDSLEKSSANILHIMTSFPIPEADLLSPLSDSLLHLTEKEKLLRESRSCLVCKDNQESSSLLVDEYSSVMVRGEGKACVENKMELVEKSLRSMEVKHGIGKATGNEVSAHFRKEIDLETPASRELISNSLKLLLPSSSKCTVGDTSKGTVRASEVSMEARKPMFKENIVSSDFAKEETFESIARQNSNKDEKLNSKISSVEKVWEDKKASFQKEVQSVPRKDGRGNDDNSYNSFKADFSVSKGRKGLNGALVDPPRSKVSMKAKSHEQDGAIHNGKEQPSSRGKKKSKGSRCNTNPGTEFPEESLRVGSSASSKYKKKSSGEYPSKNKLDDNRLSKESGKIKQSRRDSFGDVKMVHAVNSLEMATKAGPKNTKLEVFEKETHPFAEKSKERSTGKNVELTSGAYPEAAKVFVPPTGNGLRCDPVPATGAPVVIEENWVCCDRCQKWRLLPFGTNPDHLPKKWLCSMLDWLPRMNHCNISEEETTKALNALYLIPVPETQNNLQRQPDGAVTGVTFTEVRHLDQMQQDHNLLAIHSQGKKKHGLMETSNTASCTGLVQFSNSAKNNLLGSMKSRRLNEVSLFPLESNLANKAGFQHSSKSNDSAVEKLRHKQKEKHRLVPDGGDANHLQMKSKREADQDGLGASKKSKTGGLYYADEDWNSDHGGITGKVCPNSSNGFLSGATGKDVQKYGEYSSSKDSKCDAKDSLSTSRKKLKDPVQVSLDGQACDQKDIIVKKRKVKERKESQIYLPETQPSAGHYLQVNKVSLEEETSERHHRKEKKARLSQSEGKVSNTSKGDDKADKRGRGIHLLGSSSRDDVADGMEEGRVCIEKDRQLEQCRGENILSQRTLGGIDLLKRDLGYGHPSMAATSSSSKVSGSCKSKANFQEAKGSPVESVSSSPLRIGNSDKFTSSRRILLGKDDATNVGFSVMGSSRKCSDGEGDDGSDQSETVREDRVSSVFHHGSLESSLDYQDKNANLMSGCKAKAHTETSPYKFKTSHIANDGSNILDQHNQHEELPHKEHGHDGERVNNHRHHSNGSLPLKSRKGSSLRGKDKQRSSKSDIVEGKIRVGSFNEQRVLYSMNKSTNEAEIESHDCSPYPEESRVAKHSFQDKCGVKPGKNENCNYLGKNDFAVKCSSEGRIENQSKFGGHDVSNVKLGAPSSKDGESNPHQGLLQDHESERSSYQFLSDRNDSLETGSGRGKLQLLTHSRNKQETKTRCPQPISGTQKGSGLDAFPVDASGGGSDALKVTKHPLKLNNQDGAHHNNLRRSTSNELVVSDLVAPSPVRKDSSNQVAANALKEAKDLKHSADRLKNSGVDLERTGLYFQAALKFLHGASLLELCNVESAKHGETQSMQVYNETASLCGFVAHEYERCKEMAAAALAYKCMEVAYMRVVYSKHSNANKDRLELQAALQMVPPGESSSSSASDVDNLNNQGIDKVALGKGVTSHSMGNHVIVAQNRPNFVRLLNFAWDANLAMEASRKSQNAFAAANVSLEEAKHGEGLSSVRRVLDFNFHNVQGLLRLVRLAMEAISR